MDDDEFTYAALRRIERQENTNPRLSKLMGPFWERMGEHLGKIRQAFQDQQEDDPTSHRTVVLADELRNTQRLAESIWSLREKKVVHAALAATRKREGPVAVIENATAEEKLFFEGVCKVLKDARDQASISDPFSKRRAKAPGAEAPPSESSSAGAPVVAVTAPVAKPASTPVEPAQSVAAAALATQPAPASIPARPALPGPGATPRDHLGSTEQASARQDSGQEEGQAQAEAHEGRTGMGGDGQQEVELRLVQALGDVPRFAGPDLTHYELEKGEIGNLPARAADLLERRGVVRVLPAT